MTDASGSQAPQATATAQPPAEPVVLFDNRMLWFVGCLVGIAMFANDAFNGYVRRNFIKEPPVIQYNLEPGASTELDITVVTGDMKRLMCASDKEFEGAHCGYQEDKKKPWPRPEDAPIDDNLKGVIQPYRTLAHNQLVLVSDLWVQPEVAMRVHQEPPHVLPVKRQARFTALCKVKMLGRFESVWVRWEPGQQWYNEKNVPVARAESCRIQH